MALALIPRTELEAVNTMLQLSGEQPVNTLETSGISEVSIARSILHSISREIQSFGLHCNSETDYPLLPDATEGFIYLPDNTLRVDATDPLVNVTQRDNRLYDKAQHTYVFDKAINVDITFFLAFEDLPQTVREYITVRAARQFQVQTLGSDTLQSLTEQDERIAWMNLQDEEMDSGDYSIFDSYSTRIIIDRII